MDVRFLAQLAARITLIVVRLLILADYGLLALAAVLAAFVTMVSQFGGGTAMVQAMELDAFNTPLGPDHRDEGGIDRYRSVRGQRGPEPGCHLSALGGARRR